MMENPEEVLQALDEFQKMRPSEIPRELEDYLCWVARTGDPVYQWSLVKALFREKLVRVMSDFYENCPTLDLAPCPNVEQFNYDNMKQILIERLDSFSNAPFTVQRICELLTTPRKEYNRIDKFMRAIEKNILVVSTREPGPCGRRSENGDGLVNGTMEDEISHQTSNEVDMDNWVKDCITIVVPQQQQQQQDEIELKNGVIKEQQLERMEHHLDATASTFVSDFQTTPPEVATAMPNINQEPTAITGDVSEAITNEDTSSQPSLELESEDSNSNDSKKLQTTFEAKDFETLPEDQSKTYSHDNLEVLKEIDLVESSKEEIETDPLIEPKLSNENDHIDIQNVSEVIEKDTLIETKTSDDNVSEIDPIGNINEISPSIDNEETKVTEPVPVESVLEPVTEATTEPKVSQNIEDLPLTESTDLPIDPISFEAQTEGEKSIVEETTDRASFTTDSSEFTIEKASEEKSISTSPIIEESKEEETVVEKPVETGADANIETINNGISESISWNEKVESNLQKESIEDVVPSKPLSESMDVDNDVNISPEEPMEEERAVETMNS